MFEHSTDVVLCDDVLDGFVGKRCSGTKDGIGGGYGKSVGYDYVGFSGFAVE